jgi:hypothetical protein
MPTRRAGLHALVLEILEPLLEAGEDPALEVAGHARAASGKALFLTCGERGPAPPGFAMHGA